MSYGSNYSRHEEEEEAVDAINQQKLILTNPKTLQTPTEHGAYCCPPPIIIQKSAKHFWWTHHGTVWATTCG